MQEPKTLPFNGIPERDGYVLAWIRKDQLKQINDISSDVEIERMPWALQVTGIKSRTTLVPILEDYRNILDVDNGGCVYYPGSKGVPWKFVSSDFRKFVLKHKRVFTKARI